MKEREEKEGRERGKEKEAGEVPAADLDKHPQTHGKIRTGDRAFSNFKNEISCSTLFPRLRATWI